MNHKVKLGRLKKNVSKALSVVLSAALFVSGLSASFTTTVSAETLDNVVVESIVDVTDGDTFDTEAVDAEEEVAVVGADTDLGYDDFTENTLVATLNFGSDITASNTFDGTKGFSDVEYNTAAAGWVDGVYYPREISRNEAGATYVSAATDSLAIASKVWTESEETGYGVYTYENTSTYDMVLAPADYKVSVTFVNPTDAEYTASIEAEDITKVSDIKVAAGAAETKDFTAVLVDGTLNLKFLAASAATSADEAATQNVYVSKVVITRLATQQPASKPTIFVASDSTVQSYEDYEYPKTGWGQTLHLFFGEEVEEREAVNAGYSQCQVYEAENVIVENRAIGGRSSSSFVKEGKLDDLLEDIKKGDYLFVQWGHNDATAARPNRYVAPENFEKWIQYYVDGAKQRGAIPVLVTPVARHSFSNGVWSANFEAYGNVMRKMAAEQDLALIDLTASSGALCNSFGEEGAKALFMMFGAGEWPNYTGGSTDQTHLSYYGAYKFAQCVAKGVQESTHADLAALKDLVVVTLPTEVPAKVENLASTTVGSSSISMKWDAAEGTELYYIWRAVLEDGQTVDDVVFSDEPTDKYSAAANTAYTDANCEAGVTYVYAVRGFNELGLGEFSEKIVVTTKEAGYKFDFNYQNSPTMEGWTGVNHDQMYDAETGYGWTKLPGGGRDRNNPSNADFNDMSRDFTLGAGEFAVDLPNGDYEITFYAADLLADTSTIKPSYTAEGLAAGGISCKQSLGSSTSTVRVEDGQLNIVVTGTNLYLNGMTITELQLAPSGFGTSEFEMNLKTGKASYLIGFNPVPEAVSYNVYAKNSTDKDFKVVKSFTVEEYAADDLACRAMSADVGEIYQLYITAITATGDETARSNIVEQVCQYEGDPAAAPENLVCVSPTEEDTELKTEISLAWDPVTIDYESVSGGDTVTTTYGAIKYVIYRSERAEGEKGFQEFKKVGESKTNSYTDTDVATNINYYYKVKAVTLTGPGEISEACKTPITGTLVAVNRETYSDRALVAMNLAGADGGETVVTATDAEGNEYTSGVYMSWRSFEADFDENNELTTTFTVYRDGVAIAEDVKVTNMVDPEGSAASVYKVVGSNDEAIGVSAKDTAVWANKYLELNLYAPEDETMPDGSTCDYHANDMSVGDLNGDGDLELIVKWYPSNAKDNSGYGYTGKTFLDGYDVDFATGKVSLMWRIDMGINIRSGAHYTQFQVWDFDGDGKAEIAVKTADGTTTYTSTDGTLAGLVETTHVGACNTEALPTNEISGANDYRNENGFILEGPEYFSIFNGEDATKAADDVEYLPERGNVGAWGDAYGNRVDRFLSATAYLNGTTPFAVFCRGYYTRTCLTAYGMLDTNDDGIGDTIDVYWEFDTDKAGSEYEAQGNHGLSVNDIDGDSKDEIIYGALVIDNDGTVKYSTGLGHGDAMHVSDWVSWNDGLEVMSVHEHDNVNYHVEVRDAETGEILMGYYTGKDTGRGAAADIDPTAEGAEWWSIASPTYESNDEPAWDSTGGEVYSSHSTLENLIKLAEGNPAPNGTIFWDGDLLSEIQDHAFNEKEGYVPIGVKIYDWNYEEGKQEALLDSTEIWSINGTKGNVGLMADILGDWREEIIARTSTDKNVVRIYSTTIETDYVVPCLLENLAYREGVAWQNVGYNQPANLSYLLSQGTVTSELSEGNVYYNSAEIVFTPANDGDLYGHDIQGYNIYRAEGDGEYELIEYVSNGDLKTIQVNSDGSEPTEPEIIGWEDGAVVGQFDIGTKKGTAEGFTDVSTTTYSSATGYGFTSLPTDYAGKGTYVADSATALDMACQDVAFAAGSLEFKFDVKEAGKYRVDVYAGSLGGADDTKISVNGTDLGTVANTKATTAAAMLKTIEVELKAGEQIVVLSSSANNARAVMSAIIVTKLEPIYEDVDAPKVEIVKETLYEEDFEDGTKPFTLIAEGNAAYEYLEADTSTANANTSKYIYGVGSRSGDTGTQLANALGISDNVKVAFDLKMDGCYTSKGSSYSLLGAKNTANWLDSSSQILTISAKVGSTAGYWETVTVNGVDITSTAAVRDTGEASGKGNMQRGTTGWLRVEAELDFENQVMDITIKRISNDSVVYENEALPFVNEVSSLEYIYMAAGKTYGGVFTDNIEIYTETEVPVEEVTTETFHVYTDEDLKGNTTYSYKVAAVVNDRASFLSQPITLTTAIDIADWEPFDLEPIVEGTPIADGETVASLLPKTHPVTDSQGNQLESEVIWDVSSLDINKTGTYTIYATFKGQTEKIETTVEVVANEVKGIKALEDITTIVGLMPELPATVEVEFTNTTTVEKSVTWDTAPLEAIINTVSSCDLVGTVDEYPDHKATVHIEVVPNYIVSVPEVYIEVDRGCNATEFYPEQIDAVWADGQTIPVDVTWDDVAVDTSTVNNGILDGTVEGWEAKIKLNVQVKNPVVARFDFSISESQVGEGWTGVVVNPRGGTATAADLGILYSKDKGYGFIAEDSSVIQGRYEDYSQAGSLSKDVYCDYVLGANTFVVDVPNGKYEVDIMNTCGIGSSKLSAKAEGTDISVSGVNVSYSVGSGVVEVLDGQLTVEISGGTPRWGALVVRSVPEIALDQSEVTLTKGENVVLNATVSQGDADHEVIWTSSDENVVTVSNGDVVAVGGGVATVIVAVPAMGLSAACEVTVKSPAVDVALTTEAVTLNKGETTNLTAVLTPADATDVLKWSSSNEHVATVTADGAVTAVGAGEATITVEIENGETATCKVIVKVPATGIELDQSAVTLDKGETVTLTATITPADTTDGYIWSSSNPAVATVVNGVVTAVGAGNATITVTTTNGMIATCVVTVVVEDDDNGNDDGGQETKDGVTYEIKGDGVTITDIDKNVAKVVIPDTVTINGKVYKVTSLPKNAFKNNKKLTSITIGNNVTSIGDYAFYGCTKLKTVKIGKNVVTIGKCAFGKNTSLTSITIPDKVKTIGVNAFDGCSKLKTVKLGKSLTAISDKMFYKCKALTKVTIPSKVTKIGKSAFAYCTKLSSVTIGKKVSTIGASAFYKCTALKKVTIPSSVKTIGGSAFTGCTKLATLTIGSKVTTIDKNAFSKCTALKKVTIPASVKTIGANAFNGCKNLKSITIKTTKLTTKSVGSKAFSGINSKATIKVPSKKLADYKKLLVSKGVKKTATIKK